MDELILLVTEAPEGGYIARALGQSIFTEADDLPSLRKHIREAVRCTSTNRTFRELCGCIS